VSSAKFAAITASLLARKGDATPSVVVPVAPVPRPALVPRDDQPVHSERRQPENGEKLRRIVVSITQDELERLGIAARVPIATTLCAPRSIIIFASSRRNSRTPVPAWKAVLPLWRGTLNPTGGRITLRILPAPKTSIRQMVMMKTAENRS
jgi:hypothetical protein